MEILKVLVAVIVPTIGWVISYRQKQKNDVQNAKRNRRVEFLLTTYLKLENSIHRSQIAEDLEQCIAEIQLMGNSEQVNLSKQIANDMSNKGEADLKLLLESLRNDLRAELNLTKIEDPIIFLRMGLV